MRLLFASREPPAPRHPTASLSTAELLPADQAGPPRNGRVGLSVLSGMQRSSDMEPCRHPLTQLSNPHFLLMLPKSE